MASISCNTDGIFTCSTQDGVRIFDIEPLSQIKHLDESIMGSVAICEVLNRTNLMAIVGLAGKRQRFSEKAVLIWDDFAEKFVAEFTFSSNVRSVKLRKDRMFVAEERKIHVFSFPDKPTKLFTVDTGPNPKGLVVITPCCASENQLLVCPGQFSGSIQIIDMARTLETCTTTFNLPNVIKAHKNGIVCLAMNTQGTLVATGSTKGTIIRVFDTQKNASVIEFRRGSGAASLHCINFSNNSEFLCASSCNGTAHIFAVKQPHLNRKLTFSGMAKYVSAYADSCWALSTFKVPEDRKCVCVFGGDSTIYAICTDGTFHKYIYTLEGKIYRKNFDKFLDIAELNNDKTWSTI